MQYCTYILLYASDKVPCSKFPSHSQNKQLLEKKTLPSTFCSCPFCVNWPKICLIHCASKLVCQHCAEKHPVQVRPIALRSAKVFLAADWWALDLKRDHCFFREHGVLCSMLAGDWLFYLGSYWLPYKKKSGTPFCFAALVMYFSWFKQKFGSILRKP